jgi:hypothetical protein
MHAEKVSQFVILLNFNSSIVQHLQWSARIKILNLKLGVNQAFPRRNQKCVNRDRKLNYTDLSEGLDLFLEKTWKTFADEFATSVKQVTLMDMEVVFRTKSIDIRLMFSQSIILVILIRGMNHVMQLLMSQPIVVPILAQQNPENCRYKVMPQHAL